MIIITIIMKGPDDKHNHMRWGDCRNYDNYEGHYNYNGEIIIISEGPDES